MSTIPPKFGKVEVTDSGFNLQIMKMMISDRSSVLECRCLPLREIIPNDVWECYSRSAKGWIGRIVSKAISNRKLPLRRAYKKGQTWYYTLS